MIRGAILPPVLHPLCRPRVLLAAPAASALLPPVCCTSPGVMRHFPPASALLPPVCCDRCLAPATGPLWSCGAPPASSGNFEAYALAGGHARVPAHGRHVICVGARPWMAINTSAGRGSEQQLEEWRRAVSSGLPGPDGDTAARRRQRGRGRGRRPGRSHGQRAGGGGAAAGPLADPGPDLGRGDLHLGG